MRAPFFRAFATVWTALLCVLLLTGCALPSGEDLAPRLPDSIAVLGDSISRATNVKGDQFSELPVHSWATGTDRADGVESHFERLRDLGADIVPFNDARSGARASDLERQAAEAVKQRVQHIVVLMGANDVCGGTTLTEFQADVRRGFDALAPLGATVLVVSIPDVTELWRLYADNDTARAVWRAFDVCRLLLAENADREAERARIEEMNAFLRAEAEARGWSHDDGRVFSEGLVADDVSTVDFFHPSLSGQARLAQITWEASPYARVVER